jgi:hypothetical protein
MITLQVCEPRLLAVAADCCEPRSPLPTHGPYSFSQDPKDLDKHNYTKFYHMLQHEEDAVNAAAAAKPKATSEVKGAARQTSAIMVGKTEAHISLGVMACPRSGRPAVHACLNFPCPSFPPQKELRTTETEWKKDLGLHSSWDSAVSDHELGSSAGCCAGQDIRFKTDFAACLSKGHLRPEGSGAYGALLYRYDAFVTIRYDLKLISPLSISTPISHTHTITLALPEKQRRGCRVVYFNAFERQDEKHGRGPR